jgi:hypothetical protein
LPVGFLDLQLGDVGIASPANCRIDQVGLAPRCPPCWHDRRQLLNGYKARLRIADADQLVKAIFGTRKSLSAAISPGLSLRSNCAWASRVSVTRCKPTSKLRFWQRPAVHGPLFAPALQRLQACPGRPAHRNTLIGAHDQPADADLLGSSQIDLLENPARNWPSCPAFQRLAGAQGGVLR